MLPRRVAASDIERGALKQILPDVQLESRPLYAAYAPGGDVPKKVRVLITYLAEWCRARAQSQDDPGRVIRLYGETRVLKGSW
jgi:DNA-binding transcriptional LysR family regulator